MYANTFADEAPHTAFKAPPLPVRQVDDSHPVEDDSEIFGDRESVVRARVVSDGDLKWVAEFLR
jgi:hypothetical protein